MKREDLIKLITDNFAEGENVSFRYYGDKGETVSTNATIAIDERTCNDGYYTFVDAAGNVIRDRVSEHDAADTVRELGSRYAHCKWTTTKSTVIMTKCIDVM